MFDIICDMAVSMNDASQYLHTIFKRGCVECPPTTPSCPSCPSGQFCSLVPQSCSACAHMTCIASTVTGGSSSSGPNVGAIAGGVVGGVAFVAIVTFLIWRFFIRDRRQRYGEQWEDEDDQDPATQKTSQFIEARDARASIHTVHSMASTMLSRASNMIPIAFIPGVTNRDGTQNTPPVPPIPAARSHGQSPLSHATGTTQGEALFFMPNDLRNSEYSTTSTLENRHTFFGRPSITPSLARESVASDIYQDDASANPMPATTVVRVRPNMVSVKSTASSPHEHSGTATPISYQHSGTATPVQVPERDVANTSDGNGPKVVIPSTGPSASGSVRSNASFGRPTPVTIVKSKGRFPVRQVSDASTTATSDTAGTATRPAISSPLAANGYEESSDDEGDPHARARQSLLTTSTTIRDSPPMDASPFSDSNSGSNRDTIGGLSAVIEEATRRASRVPVHTGLGGREGRGESPFGDEHASE